jgi:hypothetical protein
MSDKNGADLSSDSVPPSLGDDVIARIEQGGVMVDRRGKLVGRSYESRTAVRYDIMFPDEPDQTRRLAINIHSSRVRKAP